MKHLIHLSLTTWIIDGMVMYDNIVKLSKEGNEVHIFYCDETIPVCFSNPCSEKLICKWCRWYRKVMNKQLPKNVIIHSCKNYYDDQIKDLIKDIYFDYNSIEEIKKISYKGVQIGYGALSTYVSQTRNINPLIDARFKEFFNGYLKAECILVEILSKMLKEINPDVVSLFNGRFFENRPVYEYSKNLGFQVRCYETNRPFGVKNGVESIYFENNLPHNITQGKLLMEKNWSDSLLSDNDKRKISDSFFNKRRSGEVAGDISYTADQIQGLLPNNWDKQKNNIVIFNSSEDEFFALGDEYDNNNFLYKNQIDAIRSTLELFKRDNTVHFYLRVHPNLKKVKYRYHLDLYNLSNKYMNLTVISANQKVSSYALLENADKIIVFGSTIGIEAVYWSKPVILLNQSFYSLFDICYIPKNEEELKKMITDKLELKDRFPAIKYGFFVMNNEKAEPIENFSTKCTTIKGKYFFFKFKPIRYSTIYLAVIKILTLLKNNIFFRNKRIPTREHNEKIFE